MGILKKKKKKERRHYDLCSQILRASQYQRLFNLEIKNQFMSKIVD